VQSPIDNLAIVILMRVIGNRLNIGTLVGVDISPPGRLIIAQEIQLESSSFLISASSSQFKVYLDFLSGSSLFFSFSQCSELLSMSAGHPFAPSSMEFSVREQTSQQVIDDQMRLASYAN
jgi:hypothetical protein